MKGRVEGYNVQGWAVGGRQTVSEAMRVEKRVKIYGLSRCKFERMTFVWESK